MTEILFFISGCKNSFYTGCSTLPLSCQPPVSCQGDEHPCLLSASCVSSAFACSCAGIHGIDPCEDNPYPSGADFPSYLPVGGTRLYVTSSDIYTVAADISVETGDVVGVLTEGDTDILSCDLSRTSQWIQNKYIFTNVLNERSSVIPRNYKISPNQVCHINAVYAITENVSLPLSLSVMNEVGVFKVGYQAAGEVKECEITVEESVSDIVWVSPALASDSSIKVEMNTPVFIVARVDQGSNLMYVWEVNGVNITGFTVESVCPSQVVAAECSTGSSSIPKPFTYITQSFQTAGQLKLIVYNEVSAKEVAVGIIIDHCMLIEGLQLFHSCGGTKCSPLVEVGVEQVFEVEITSGVVDTYSYTIDGAALNEVGKYLKYTFPKPGQYELVVNGSCGRYSMLSTLIINAKIAAHVQNLQFSSQDLKVVSVNEQFTMACNAEVQIGAEIVITFYVYTSDTNFKTILRKVNTSSTSITESVKHTYIRPDKYQVNVTIEDAFTVVSVSKSVFALHKLKNVTLECPFRFVLLDREIEFTATVSSDSGPVTMGTAMLMYNWTFPDIKVQTKTTETSVIYRQRMDVLGKHRILVEVDNYVSVVSGFITVTVEECVSDLQLSYNGPRHISNSITMVSSHHKGTNVTYIFDLGDGRRPMQTKDSVLTTQYSSVGVFIVSVNASNDLPSTDCPPALAELTVYVMDNDTLILLGILVRRCFATNAQVSLSAHVVNVNPAVLSYHWSLGDGQIASGVGEQNITATYSRQGVYIISVVVNNKEMADTTVCVQQTITGVQISTPAPAVIRTSIQVSVSVTAGSDIMYRWKVGNIDIACDIPQCSVTKDQPGTYLVKVVAYNNISQDDSEVQLVFQDVITSLSVLCSTCQQSVYANTGLTMSMMASVTKGTNVSYVWDFGDRTQENLSQVSHVFTPEGQYKVCVTASNLVDKDVECIMVVAENPISGLTLASDTTNVEIGSTVQLKVTQTTGSSVSYRWQCTNQTEVVSVFQIVTTRFDISQTYNCTVTASNHITDQAVASISITVFVKIIRVQITHQLVDSKYGAALEVLSFEGRANTDFLVSYDWNVLQDGAVLCHSEGKTLSPVCSSNPVGKYTIELTAKNFISSKSVSLNFETIQRIVNPRMSLSAEFATINTDVHFTVLMDSGSNVTYSWSVEPSDSSTCSGTGDVHVCRCSAIGTYVVTVVVQNVLSSPGESLEKQIIVQQQVTGVSISSSIGYDFQYVEFGKQLTFIPATLQGSDLQYSWVLSHGSLLVASSDSEMLSYTFTKTGVYTLVLNVSNDISTEVKTAPIEVQLVIANVVLTSDKNVTITGHTVTLMALTRVTDTTFEWTIDGTVQSTSLASFQKTFKSAKVYTVTVKAYNKVSSVSDQIAIVVEDPVGGLQITDCMVVRPALVHTTLAAAVTRGTGVSFTWAVETVTGTKKNYFGQSVVHAFESAGSFLVELFAANQVSNTSARCSINVQGIVKISSIKITSDIKYFFVNETIYFVAIGENLGDTSFNWNFGDSEVASTKNSKYKRIFLTAATYDLTVTASNNVSRDVFKIQFTIHHLECDIPDISVVGESSRTVLKSRALELEAVIDYKGCIAYNSKHIWEVYAGEACTGDRVSLGDTHTTSPVLKVKPRVLDYGKYCVMFTTMYEDTPVREAVKYALAVGASPLKAVIAGGTERRLPELSDLLLDGSLSFDPDTLDGTSSGLTYQWKCNPNSRVSRKYNSLEVHSTVHIIYYN